MLSQAFILLLMVSCTAFATGSSPNAVDVKVADTDQPYHCEFSHLAMPSGKNPPSKIYACRSGESQMLLQKNSFGWSAISINRFNRLSLAMITEVKSNTETLFVASSFLGASLDEIIANQKTIAADDSALKNASVYKMVESSLRLDFQKDLSLENSWAAPVPGAVPSSEFSKLWSLIKTKLNEDPKEFLSQLNSRQVEVELPGGQRSKCTRGESVEETLDDRAKKFFDETCGFFSCNPINIDGKAYTALLYLPPSSVSGMEPFVVTSNEIETGPIYTPIKITANGKNLFLPMGKRPKLLDSPYTKLSGTKLPEGVSIDDSLAIQSANPSFRGTEAALRTRCKTGKVTELLDQEARLVKAKHHLLNEQDLKILVQKVNGQLQPIITLNKNLPVDSCHWQDDVYYAPDAIPKEFPDFDGILHTQDAVSPEQAKMLFDWLKSMPDIPYQYIEDGCYARAEVMTSRLLAEKNIHSEKVWALGGKLSPKPDLEWGFHVAPVILVKGADHKISRMVLDPAIAQSPLPEQEWLALFHSADQGQALEIGTINPVTSAMAIFPYNRSMLFHTSSEVYTYNSSDKPSPKDDLTNALEVLKSESRYLAKENGRL